MLLVPIWEIPKDIEYLDNDFQFQGLTNAPEVYHLPRDTWNSIWDKFAGENEVIAILDTGCSPHRHLPSFKAARSFIAGQATTDGNGHGTHCAGTALGRDGIGVAPKAELIVGKVLSNSGSGSSTGIAQGIEWAIDQGATIISMSLGGGGFHAPTSKAIQRANDNGILVCASAGNAGQRLPSNTIGNPAKDMGSYCSGSMDRHERISSFSSAGREMDGVTPGSEIVSSSNSNPNGYKKMSGTSMSCPFAAGLFAVVRSGMAKAGMPRLKGIDDWRPWLTQFFMDKGPTGHDPVWGHGIPDYRKIVAYLLQESLKYV